MNNSFQTSFSVVALILACLTIAAVPAHALQETEYPIVGFSVSPIHPHYATIRENGLVEITNYETDTVIQTHSVPLPFQDPNDLDVLGFKASAITYSPDGKQIAIVIRDISALGKIYLLDIETGQVDLNDEWIGIYRVTDMSWSPGGTQLAVAMHSGGADQLILSSVITLNIASGELEHTLADAGFIDNHAFGVAEWSGSNLIAYANRSVLVVWDATSSSEVSSVETSEIIYDAAWSPDSNRIATYHGDGAIQIWDADSKASEPQQVMRVQSEKLLSHAMIWLSDDLLAINVWTNIEIWDVSTGVLVELIKTDNFIRGIGMLSTGEMAYASPQYVFRQTLTLP
ncbi:MAG: WD40 repeat domain-containing protein [Anaerolineae bacterium]|nr:WD40 repeat domain-containing protein [Anaerolineae bacterium]